MKNSGFYIHSPRRQPVEAGNDISNILHDNNHISYEIITKYLIKYKTNILNYICQISNRGII